MNNLQVTKIDNMTQEELVKKEMGEIEIYGAMGYLYQLANEFNEEVDGSRNTTFENIDSDTFYNSKTLHINSGLYVLSDEGQTFVLDCVFMIEGGKDTLWGYAHDYDDETGEELFLVRI